MMKDIFEPHGSFQLRLEGRVVFSDIEGPWNVEAVNAWAKAVGPLYNALGTTEPCASIGTFSVSILNSLESLSRLRELAQFAHQRHRLVAVATVISKDVEGWRLAETILGRIYEGVLDHRFFDNIQDARVWVDAQLAAAQTAR